MLYYTLYHFFGGNKSVFSNFLNIFIIPELSSAEWTDKANILEIFNQYIEKLQNKFAQTIVSRETLWYTLKVECGKPHDCTRYALKRKVAGGMSGNFRGVCPI